MITLAPERVLRTLLAITAVFAVINGLLGVNQMVTDNNTGAAYDLFDLNNEANIPTWYAAILLFCAGLTAMFVGSVVRRAEEPHWRHWWGVAAVLVYLSVDEAALIHERWEDPSVSLGWLVPAFTLVIVTVAVFARFFWRLPTRVRFLYLVAGACYVGGALLIDIVGIEVYNRAGSGATTGVFVIVEESLEQIGAIAFIYASLVYLKGRGANIDLQLR